jgi:hypothetical protein
LFKVKIEAHNGIDRDLWVRVGQELRAATSGLLEPEDVAYVSGKKYKLKHGGEDYSVLLS